MKVTCTLFLLALLCLATACEQAGNCPEETTYGPYYFAEESRAFTPPFQPTDTLVFRNTQGAELSFFPLRLYEPGPRPYNGWEASCGRSGDDFTRVQLFQDQYLLEYYAMNGYTLAIYQQVAYFRPGCPKNADMDESNLFDHHRVALFQPRLHNPAQRDYINVMLPTSDRGYERDWDAAAYDCWLDFQYLPTFSFQGETYRDVYTTGGDPEGQNLYFSKDYQLITFLDQQGERWWLDHTRASEETAN